MRRIGKLKQNADKTKEIAEAVVSKERKKIGKKEENRGEKKGKKEGNNRRNGGRFSFRYTPCSYTAFQLYGFYGEHRTGQIQRRWNSLFLVPAIFIVARIDTASILSLMHPPPMRPLK